MNHDDDDPKQGSGRPPTRFKERPHPENEPQKEPTPATPPAEGADPGDEALEHGDVPEATFPDPKKQEEAKKGQQPGKSGQPAQPPDTGGGMQPDPGVAG